MLSFVSFSIAFWLEPQSYSIKHNPLALVIVTALSYAQNFDLRSCNCAFEFRCDFGFVSASTILVNGCPRKVTAYDKLLFAITGITSQFWYSESNFSSVLRKGNAVLILPLHGTPPNIPSYLRNAHRPSLYVN